MLFFNHLQMHCLTALNDNSPRSSLQTVMDSFTMSDTLTLRFMSLILMKAHAKCICVHMGIKLHLPTCCVILLMRSVTPTHVNNSSKGVNHPTLVSTNPTTHLNMDLDLTMVPCELLYHCTTLQTCG